MRFLFLTLAVVAIFFFFTSTSVNATHIRAGQITAEAVSCQNLKYRFTITGYTDTGSPVQFGFGVLDFGDGTIIELTGEDVDEKIELEDQVAINLIFEEHTFPGPGTYTIRYLESNRNADIVNMDNSINTPFYIETQIVVGDPLIGCNSTPQLLNPPVDQACTGVAFFHNAGAVDPDGDSLSYEFVVPKQDFNFPVTNYIYPDVHDRAAFNALNEDQSGPATFDIDPITGDVTWDAPGGEGEYNFAFIVTEWRNIQGEWIPIGYVTRDMQILVSECENNRPEILPPPDTCVEAGTTLEVEITAEDPDGDPMVITMFGEPFSEFIPNPATYFPRTDPPTIIPNPAVSTFFWETICEHVKSRPYQVRIKAQDFPPSDRGPKLADFATWLITVVGPAPEGLVGSQGSGNEINLSWDDYTCTNATSMQVWRRVGSNNFTPDNCEIGMPDNAGYELIDIVDIDQINYLDDNFGEGLQWGATYCYRLVAVFPEPGGGESYVSEEVCVELAQLSPAMTKVDIDVTDSNNGVVELEWVSPFDQDELVHPRPYRYELYRAPGFEGGTYTRIDGGALVNDDTTFTDNSAGLDTENDVYNYFVIAIDANNTVIDSAKSASTVRLEAESITGAIQLNWAADVPWSNQVQNFPYHLIFRNNVGNNPDQLVLVDSVNVLNEGFSYLDDGHSTGENGLDENLEYCYFVTTRGAYGSDEIPEPLINRSQIICAQPNDSVPPCTPGDLEVLNLNLDGFCEEFLKDKPCDFDDFFNDLTWSVNTSLDSCDDIRSYNIYFSPTGQEEDFSLIANVEDTFFTHEDIPSFKGCYKITSVDRSGNESGFSETVCNDNCPQYQLPNVFSPNDDGFNDTFRAFGEQQIGNGVTDENRFELCPRFIEKVEFTVVNRWGKTVFEYVSDFGENTIYINWDGKTNEGRLLSSGYYFYSAKVTVDVLDPSQTQMELKGWVRIVY
jgi:hypothetical protein